MRRGVAPGRRRTTVVEEVAMEAATAPGSPLLARDGGVPTAPRTLSNATLADRQPIDGVTECACCGRFPLIGERVVRHEGRKGGGWVCDGCEHGGRGEGLGRIVATERVRSLGGAMNVRRAS
jgi:hypothetical protein